MKPMDRIASVNTFFSGKYTIKKGTVIRESFAHIHKPTERSVITDACNAIKRLVGELSDAASAISENAVQPKKAEGSMKITPASLLQSSDARLLRYSLRLRRMLERGVRLSFAFPVQIPVKRQAAVKISGAAVIYLRVVKTAEIRYCSKVLSVKSSAGLMVPK